MTRPKPLIVGSTLSLTVGLGYTLCAIAFAVFPNVSVAFTTSLFHGLDFSSMKSNVTEFSLASYLVALVVMMVWAFVVGAAYGWIFNRLTQKIEDRGGSISASQFSPSRT